YILAASSLVPSCRNYVKYKSVGARKQKPFYFYMCQVFLGHYIISHYSALYFCTFSQLPALLIASLHIFESFQDWEPFQYIVKSLARRHVGYIYCFDNPCNRRMKNRPHPSVQYHRMKAMTRAELFIPG